MDPFHQIRGMLDWLAFTAKRCPNVDQSAIDPMIDSCLRRVIEDRERLALAVWNSGGPRR